MNIFKILTINTFLFFLPSFFWAQVSFDEYINEELRSPFFEQASLGISICDLKSGEYLAGYNAGKWMVPASSLKVVTTFCTLAELGKTYQYATKIVLTGSIDHHGVLQGDIIIQGSGDPALGSSRYEERYSLDNFIQTVVESIQQAGIKKIEGDIIADYSIFSDDPIPPTWQWDDLGNYYGCGAWGINVLENTYFAAFDRNHSIGRPASYLYMDPYIPGFELLNEVYIDSAGTGDQTNIYSYPLASTAKALGRLPKGRGIYKIRGSIPNPPMFLAYRLYQSLQKKGIGVRQFQSSANTIATNDATELAIFHSPLLPVLIREALQSSINMYCEVFLKTLGSTKGSLGSRQAGIQVLESFIENQGIAPKEFHLEDGSGLSARNQISPYALSRFLCRMDTLFGTETLTDLLAEAGKEGTLSSLLKSNPIQQFVWGKTGSMKGVYSLTGICKAKSGRWLSFSIIINGSPEKSAVNRSKIEEILEGIYNFF